MHIDSQTIPCFFLHDSFMAAFQEEQTFFRLQFLATVKKTPFTILPPLCPCSDIPDQCTPEIGALVVDAGWILHPCNFGQNHTALSPKRIILPGLPPFPHTPGFVLGYAGDKAADLVTMPCSGTKKLPKTPFLVKFWYRANVTIESTRNQDSGSIFAKWTIGERIGKSVND